MKFSTSLVFLFKAFTHRPFQVPYSYSSMLPMTSMSSMNSPSSVSISSCQSLASPITNRKRVRNASPKLKSESSSRDRNLIHVLANVEWIDLNVPLVQLSANLTLRMGQCFNWKKLDENSNNTIWIGVINIDTYGYPIAIRQMQNTTEFADILNCQSTYSIDMKALLYNYFQLDYDLKELYKDWSSKCDRMKVITKCLPGVRVVRQDPWECLVSFICSSNNNIKRITQMLDKLKIRYGMYKCSIRPKDKDETIDAHGEIDHKDYYKEWEVVHDPPSSTPTFMHSLLPEEAGPSSAHHLYSFPTAQALAAASEDELRAAGLGYRARYVLEAARALVSRESSEAGAEAQWFKDLRSLGIRQASTMPFSLPSSFSPSKVDVCRRLAVQAELITLAGVGPKVADCVALFCLDQAGAIPVDTHVWDIAVRDYAPQLRIAKSLTPTIYEQVGNIFRDKFGDKAGWAHSVLFAAELPEFKRSLPDWMQLEMNAFSEETRRTKAATKVKKTKVKEEHVQVASTVSTDAASAGVSVTVSVKSEESITEQREFFVD